MQMVLEGLKHYLNKTTGRKALLYVNGKDTERTRMGPPEECQVCSGLFMWCAIQRFPPTCQRFFCTESPMENVNNFFSEVFQKFH